MMKKNKIMVISAVALAACLLSGCCGNETEEYELAPMGEIPVEDMYSDDLISVDPIFELESGEA